jgi:CheY-like chemotaxis protein
LITGIQEEEKDRIVLHFQVKDNGVGINSEKLERIFESFVQGDNQQNLSLAGVGLGLTITKQLVEQQGGRISVESEQGKETAFSFYLPFRKARAEKVQSVEAHATPTEDIEGGRILLVEDIELNRELAMDMMSKTFPQIEILTAASGKEALEILEAAGMPDLILMDVRMPEMDGLTCTRLIRERHGAIVPIIALTASATEEEMKRCVLYGMDGFLAKPFTPDQLTQAIHDVLSPLPAENKLSVNREKLSHFLGNDENRIARYLTVSRDEIFRHYRSLRVGISQQDWDSSQIAAHSLKTTFRYLGIDQVAERFAAMEKAIQRHDEGKILAALPDMARAVRGYWKSREGEENEEMRKFAN